MEITIKQVLFFKVCNKIFAYTPISFNVFYLYLLDIYNLESNIFAV